LQISRIGKCLKQIISIKRYFFLFAVVGNFKGIPFVQNYIFRRTYLQATGLLEEGMDITERQLEYFTQRRKEVLKQAEW